MSCKEIEELLIDYQEGNLDGVTRAAVTHHLQTCPACRQVAEELNTLLVGMATAAPVLPDRAIERDFLDALARDEAALRSAAPPVRFARLRPYWKIAAMIALAIGSFWAGLATQQQTVKEELAFLEREYHQLNKLVALSLLQDQSASKRLQAMNYADAIPEADAEIIAVLIQKMESDKHTNVRLAAANALARFADNNLVVEALIEALRSERKEIMQVELIQILVKAREKRAVPVLRQLLKKEEVPPLVKEQINAGLIQLS
ncbi:MAG: zf-HC2 domain-containing protein [Bacteroidota bacterium]